MNKGGLEEEARCRAKVQIGAELLCKSAKVNLGVGVGTGVGVGKYFQVSGLSPRVPGSGVQVRVQVRDPKFAPHPHLYLITRTRDLGPESAFLLSTGQLVNRSTSGAFVASLRFSAKVQIGAELLCKSGATESQR